MKNSIDLSKLTDVEIYKLVLQRKISRFPRNFWNNDNALKSSRNIVKYLIEDILNWTDEDIKNNLSQKTFNENSLKGMFIALFKQSPYLAINNVYPNKFKPWELKVTPCNFWNETTAYEFIKWLIEDKYKWNHEEIKQNFSKTWVINLGYDAATDCIKEDTFGIINKLYPNKFKPWELKQVHVDYWTYETIGEAIKWLVEDKLKLDPCTTKISANFLSENGLNRLLVYMYKKRMSLKHAINAAYPELKK